MNNKGFTIIELLIVMTLTSIIILIGAKFYNSTNNLALSLREHNRVQIDSRNASYVLSKEIFNAGAKYYTDPVSKSLISALVYYPDSSSIWIDKDTLKCYILDSKGGKKDIDSIKVYIKDNTLMLNKKNKIYSLGLKVDKIQYGFGISKPSEIPYNDLDCININKNGNDLEFNGGKACIYGKKHFTTPGPTEIVAVFNTVYKKNFPEGLDTFMLSIVEQDKDTVAYEYFIPTEGRQEIKLLCDKALYKAKLVINCKANKGILTLKDLKVYIKNDLTWSSTAVEPRYIRYIKMKLCALDEKDVIIETPNNGIF